MSEPRYIVAPTSLLRVLRFTSALSAMMESADGAAEDAPVSDVPSTTAELLAPQAEATRKASVAAERMARMFESLVQEGRAAEIAPVIVARADGADLTERDVEADDFPADVFVEAFEVFEGKSGALSRAVLGLRSGTGSPGTAESATNPSSSS